jgi:phosphatidate phosphatase PAH1
MKWAWMALVAAACSYDVQGDLPEDRPPPKELADPVDDTPLPTEPITVPPAEEQGITAVAPPLRRCVGRPFTPDPKQSWKQWYNAVVATGRPRHAGRDEIVAVGTSVTVKGKFAYGSVSKDLEKERVRLFLDDCTGWKRIADLTTDTDGRAQYNLGVLPAGVYDVRFEVMGDRTLAPATLWVLPAGTHVAVFDIDGTLTTDDGELVHEVFSDIFFDEYLPEAYPFARELTLAHEAIGHIPVYLTGRPYWLTFHTRRWLSERDFAAAPLRVTDSNTTSLPTNGNVGAYKRDFLNGLRAAGFVVDFAYGNASTDIYAYLAASISAGSVYIIGKHAGEQGTHGVSGSWEARVGQVESLPPAPQPFSH